VQAVKVDIVNKQFLPALSAALSWLQRRGELPKAVIAGLKPLFERIKVHSSHTPEDLRPLFSLAKLTKASLQWLSRVKEPFLLMGELE
jgi:hypothetical protein